MNRRRSIIGLLIGLSLATGHALAQAPKSLDLFGVALKGASREALRDVFKRNGLQALREDNRYWVDTYNAKGVLEGASELASGYVSATDKFAYAEYTFPTFMDEELVAKVIQMVATKYGKPSSQSGSIRLGPVSAKWQLAQGMQVEVYRGWPDTTTHLKLLDPAAYRLMQAEIDKERNAQATQKARAQSNAF
jgi:hypothetical protein